MNLMIAIGVVVLVAGVAGYVGYLYGQHVEAEYTAAFQSALHSVGAKLDAVKAEVAKLEAEGVHAVQTDVASAVARIKVLL